MQNHRFRVIEGGVRPGSPRPIVWNRLPVESAKRALVIRHAQREGLPPSTQGGSCSLSIDDGREFLVGIRDFHPQRQPQVLTAWLQWAKGEGLQVVDERLDR